MKIICLQYDQRLIFLFWQPDDFTVVAGMANGLISIQHRQTNAEARALNSQSRKEKQREKQLVIFYSLSPIWFLGSDEAFYFRTRRRIVTALRQITGPLSTPQPM